MNCDKKRATVLSILICVLCALLLFVPIGNSGIWAAALLVPAALIVFLFIKKRRTYSINKYQVLLIVVVSALLTIMLRYFLALFFGMAKRAATQDLSWFLQSVLPLLLVIISTELIRTVFLAQNHRLTAIAAYGICLLSDILLVSTLSGLQRFADFMDMMGLTVLPAAMGNLLYQYLNKRYGLLPGLSMRLLLTVCPVVIPYVPFTPDALTAFIGMIVPLLVYFFIDLLYERKFVTHRRSGGWSYVGIGSVLVLMLSVVMIVSCQFRYGALVIGSGSMTGELNTGDLAVYERYEDQILQVGDVVVFKSGSSRVIHRITDIDQVNGELRYITKGDANETEDLGYRVDSDLVGVVRFKIAYVGYPTIWMNDLFTNAS